MLPYYLRGLQELPKLKPIMVRITSKEHVLAEEIFFMVGTESEDNGREHLSVLGESDEKGVVSVYRLFGILGSRANRNTKLNIVTAKIKHLIREMN